MSFLDKQRAAAQAEEDFFAEIRAAHRARTETVVKPSRSGGPSHVIVVDRESNTPIDSDHPCSCRAGNDGRFCWAVLELLQERGTSEVAAAARALAASRKSVKNGRHNRS